MRQRLLPLLLAALLVGLVGVSVPAGAVSYLFSGSISCLSPTSANCSDPLGLVGDSFSATLQLSGSDGDVDPTRGFYASAVQSLQITLGSPTSYSVGATGGNVEVFNDRFFSPVYQDKYEVSAFSGTSSNLGYAVQALSLLLLKSGSSAPVALLSSDGLAQSIDPSQAGTKQFVLWYGNDLNTTTKLKLTITSIVPEPGTAFLLSAGLAALAAQRRRRV